MRKIIFLCTVVLICTLTITGCKKENVGVAEQTKDLSFSKEKKLIESAQKFFSEEVLPTSRNSALQNGAKLYPRHALKKTPLWEKAYIGLATKGKIVIVPLNYEKSLFQKVEDMSINLQDYSWLFMFEEVNGSFRTEVVTHFPDKQYLTGKADKFSGIIIVEEWEGNTIKKYLCQPSANTGKITETCYVRDYYLCDVDQYGNKSNCEYLYTEDLGCTGVDNTSLMTDPEGGVGGSDTYSQEEYILVDAEDWRVAVQIDGYWTVWSTEVFKGVRKPSATYGGHFVGISHGGDMLVGSPDFIWTRNSVTTNYVLGTASSTISGKVRWSGINPDETFINSKTRSWKFYEVFN